MDYSAAFVHDPELAFLNAGTQSRTPIEALDWMDKVRRESQKNPTAGVFLRYGELWRVQERLAGFLGADAQDLFFRHNVTMALNDFLFALPLESGEEILATGWEYGGTALLARWRAEQGGLAFRQFALPLRPALSAEEIVARTLEELRPSTRVLVLSHVVTGTGAVLPIAAIARGARERGVIVVVDGAHAVGALPVSLRELDDVDCYGGNFHKWFMGPTGTGFGWVHPRWRGRLAWKFGGWASFSPAPFMKDFGGGDEEASRRFPNGTIDPFPFMALGKVLDFWEREGPAKIRSVLRGKRELAAAEVAKLGWERVGLPHGSEGTPLVSYFRPGAWNGPGADRLPERLLRECRVQIAFPHLPGEALVRFSPGIYSTDEEIRAGIARIGAFRP